MTATVAVPPLTAFPPLDEGGVELELQPTATMAATATTATPVRRRVRLPRYICAPLSWRTGAALRLYRSCGQKPRRPGLDSPSRGGSGGWRLGRATPGKGRTLHAHLPPLLSPMN